MAILFPGESVAPLKPDLELIESFDNSQIGGVEKYSTISTGVISIADVMPKAGGTFTGNVAFQNTQVQGESFVTPINSASTTINWARVSKSGSNLTDIATRSHTSLTDIGTKTHAQIDTHISDQAAGAHIVDADGTLADVTSKFNTLLLRLETAKLLASS